MKHLWLMCALTFVGCDCGGGGTSSSTDGLVRYVGRLAIPDARGCFPRHNGMRVFDRDCHRFKRRFDFTTGAPIDDDKPAPGDALRPLVASVELSVLKSGSSTPCTTLTFQTDRDGVFNAPLPRCGAGVSTTVVGRVFLQYEMRSSDFTRRGTIRGAWQDDTTLDILPGIGSLVASRPGFVDSASKPARTFRIPEFIFTASIPSEPAAMGSTLPVVNLGTQVFGTGETGDDWDYLNQVLIGWANVVELHHRLRDVLGDDAQYQRMFPEMPLLGLAASYLVTWDGTWAFAGVGGMQLLRGTVADIAKPGAFSWNVEGLLSSTGTLSHELSHSIHFTLAGASGGRDDYRFGSLMVTPDGGADYDWGHGGGQLQELGAAFNEGWATAVGQWLINRCANSVTSHRPNAEGFLPFHANQFSGDATCDAVPFKGKAENGCGYHHVRYHLRNRGLFDGDRGFDEAVGRLQAHAAHARDIGHLRVLSNNELRMAEYFCDVLDDDPDVGYAMGIAGRKYLRAYATTAVLIMDGWDARSAEVTVPSNPGPENVVAPFKAFLEVTNTFCTDCAKKFSLVYDGDYLTRRIDPYTGSKSAIAFSKGLVSKGVATDAQVRNLLRANWMEDDY